jgi:DNA-binding beta-propeller fold protein YncE
MKTITLCIVLSSLNALSAWAISPETSSPLQPEKPIVLSGKSGHFDFMAADPSMKRILAAHKGAGTLQILESETGRPVLAVNTGESQGVAIDSSGGRYFVGNDGEHNVVTIDARTLKKTSSTAVDGAVDAIAFDSQDNTLYADEDDGTRLWVIDTTAGKVLTTVTLPGKPEVIEYDPTTDHLYQNIKDKNLVVRIDAKTRKIDATWSTLPALSPHGLAVDEKSNRLYVAGSNGKLVAMDATTGKVVSSTDIAPRVDQIAYDAENHTIYCACKGVISVVKVTDPGLALQSNVPSPAGAHTLAVDMNHDVWVSFSDNQHSYLQKFKASH